MREMHWSWGDLTGDNGTPVYVQGFCMAFLNAEADHRARQQDQPQSSGVVDRR